MVISPHMERELCRTSMIGKVKDRRVLFTIIAYFFAMLKDLRLRLSLTSIFHRRNNIYSRFEGKAYGQTQKAHAETAGTQAHRHPQSSPEHDLRPFVSRQPVLRSPRSAASTLRDVATSPHGGRFSRRGGLSIRSLSPNFLSGPSSIRSCWPDRTGAQTTRPKRRSQTLCRSNRACPELEAFGTGHNDDRMRQGDQGGVRTQHSSAHSRTSTKVQKKTPPGERRFPFQVVPARHTRDCVNESLNPMDAWSMLKAEASSYAMAWRDGRNCSAPRQRRRCPLRSNAQPTLNQKSWRPEWRSSNSLPV